MFMSQHLEIVKATGFRKRAFDDVIKFRILDELILGLE